MTNKAVEMNSFKCGAQVRDGLVEWVSAIIEAPVLCQQVLHNLGREDLY